MSATGNELVKLNQLKSTYDKFINGTTVVGRADNLKSQSTTLTSNFNFRPTASTYTNGAWVGTSIETKDGANLKSIKGKSYVRNQLVYGNFVDTSEWALNRCTMSVSNNIATCTCNATTYNFFGAYNVGDYYAEHKYLRFVKVKCSSINVNRINLAGISYTNIVNNPTPNTWYAYFDIVNALTSGSDTAIYNIQLIYNSTSDIQVGDTMTLQNCNLIDLTKHFNGNANIPSEVLNMTTLDTTILAKYGIKLDGVYEAGEVENFGQNGNITVDFNQLANYNLSEFRTENGITYENIGGGKVRVYGTAVAPSVAFRTYDFNVYSSHKYYLLCGADGGSNSTYNGELASSFYVYDLNRTPQIFTAPSNATANISFYVRNGVSLDKIFVFQLFDLTQMFGAGNEPATVEEFRELYPNDYYDYTTSRSETLSLVKVKTRGFNAWNEKWESGSFSTSTGATSVDTTRIRSKEFISVLPNTRYYLKSTNGLLLLKYGIDKNYLGVVSYSINNDIIQTTNDTYFLKFSVAGTTYNHDICINLSWSGTKNGLYETYTKNIKSLPIATYFPNGMCGIGNVYDELTERKAIKKWSSYTFTGNEECALQTDAGYQLSFYSNIISFGSRENILMNDYNVSTVLGWGALPNMSIMVHPTDFRIFRIRDDRYTTKETFLASLVGKTIYYELATPVETNIDIDLSYTCNDWGTEELISTNSVPINADVVYWLDVKNEVKNLRQNYISLPSFNNLANEIKNEYGITITPTFGVDQYNFSINDPNPRFVIDGDGDIAVYYPD